VNYDGRSKLQPRGIVKANAVVDNDYLKDARSRLRNAPTASAFTGEGLTIEGNEMFKIYDTEPVVIHRGRATMNHATGRQMQPHSRSDAVWQSRVSVVGTLNGALGKTKHDILEQFAAFGVAENPDRLGQTNALNVIFGGFFTVANGPKPIIGGDYIMVDCPDPANPASFPTRAVAGNIANRGGKNGRIAFYYAPYRPLEVSWYQGEAVANAIKRSYEEVAGKPRGGGDAVQQKLWIKKAGPPSYTGHNQSHLVHEFDKAVVEQVEALTDMLRAAPIMNAIPDGLYFEPKDGGARRGRVDPGAHVQGVALWDEPVARDAAIRIMLAAGHFSEDKSWKAHGMSADLAGKVSTLFKLNPFQRSMRAQAQFRLKVEEWVIGRAVTGAAPYKDFDLHMRGFGR
jgi:hypothetical protein